MDLQSILGKLFANAGAVGIEGVFQFVFGPEQAYWSEVRTSSRTEAGRHASPDVTIEVAHEDFLGIMGGMANIEELFASGRLKIGDAFWTAEGPDLPAGTRVKVVSANNMSLQVRDIE